MKPGHSQVMLTVNQKKKKKGLICFLIYKNICSRPQGLGGVSFVCQAIFPAHQPGSCLCLCLESLMKLQNVPPKLATLHSLTGIDPQRLQRGQLCFFLISLRLRASPTCTGLIIHSGPPPVGLGLDCVYCWLWPGAVLWFFLVPTRDDRLFFQPRDGKVHSHPARWLLSFLRATFPQPSFTLFVLLPATSTTIQFSLYATTHAGRQPMFPFLPLCSLSLCPTNAVS